MKRSEMLEILEEAILDNYDYAIDTGPYYDYNGILKTLEDAGMMPPEDWAYKNKWESEDES